MGMSEHPGTTRRRAISIFGAAAGLSLAGIPWSGARAAASLFTWEGSALGADASITLAHESREAAQAIIDLAIAEVRRLEDIFSLHLADSELSRLNRDGRLSNPSLDMLTLLTESKRYSEMSDGVFDVTVQPLWTLYSGFFRANPDSKDGPPPEELRQALRLVDYRRMDVNPLFVRFDREGMGVTLNGIAQGYITDQVADLLRRNGIGNVLVDLGEVRALDTHPDGRPWNIALKDPRAPARTARTLDVTNMAVATSGGYGKMFDRAGRFHHMFDPHNGGSASQHIGVSVISSRATTADALSTAIYVAATSEIERIVRRAGKVTAIVTFPDGSEQTFQA